MQETSTFIPITTWLAQISNLGMIVFLMGALMQYVLLRFKGQINITQTFPILVISRIISIILAWSISFYIPAQQQMVRGFVYVPAVIAELFLMLFTYAVLVWMIKKSQKR